MDIKQIHTKEDYEAALKAAEALWDAKRSALEDDKLDALVELIEAYEAKHFAIDLPSPIDASRY